MNKINACILGARSLSSGPLLKLLLEHEHVNISMLISAEGAGKDIQDEHTFLRGMLDKKMESYNPEKIIDSCNVVFCINKHDNDFHQEIAKLVYSSLQTGKGVKFIDLGADFRLKDPNLYDEWYHFEHKTPALLQKAVYGLTELNRDKIKDAILVANPGCYPTASLLTLAPLLKNNVVDCNESIIIDAYSGVSGVGKSKNNGGANLAINVEGNIIPYKIGHEHQHIPEMEQEISTMLNKQSLGITFSPHVLSFKYGILSTSYVKLKEPYEWEYIYSLYKSMYENEPFIHILGKNQYPQVADVEGTNFCDIGFRIDKRTKYCIAMGAIDNVIKGASGQAVQNMNVMFGFDEVEGLPRAKTIRKKLST